MFINDIFKKRQLNEGGFDIPEIPRAPQPKPVPTKDKTVDEDRFDKDDQTVRLPPHMTGRDPTKPSVDIPGTSYTVSVRGDDPTTQQDARHIGTMLASVPSPLTKATGMAMRYAGQDPNLSTGEKVARAMDSAGNPDEISRYLKKKAVKEQDKKINPLTKKFEPEVPNDAELDYQGSVRGRFPHYYEIRDGGAAFELDLNNGKPYTVEPGHPEWDTLYKQYFDLPTPNDYEPGRGWHIGKNPLAEAGPFSYGAKKPRKGSVADLAAKKRQEQERDKQPVEPRDQRVGVAKVTKGVSEGISVVDQDYDLDQLILTLDIEGKKVYFTYWDYEEDFANAERRDVFNQLQEQPWYKGLDHPTKMEILDAAFRAIRGLEPQEYRPTVRDEPLDEQGVAEEEGDVSAPSDAYLNSQSFKQQQERDVQRIAEPKKISSSSTGGTIYKTDKGTIHRAGHPASLNIGDVSQYGVNGPYEPKYSGAERSSRAPDYDQKSLTPDQPRFKGGNATRLPQTGTGGGPRGGGSSPSGGGMMDPFGGKKRSLYFEKKSTNEGSAQDKLYKRHQELRKKRGAPDPEYYKEFGKSYDIEDDQERYARQAELKKKYGVTNEDRERYVEELGRAGYEMVTESATLCPECGGAAYADRILAEKQDACYHKVKSRYKVWPSAYASGALVRCRKKGAANWGNKSKK